MRTAAELFLDYARGPHADLEDIIALFAEDGTLEAPYFASLGFPWFYRGRAELRTSYAHLLANYPNLRFSNPRIIAATDAVAVGEYEFVASSKRTGKKVHQLAVATLKAEHGKIQILREFQNLVEVGLGMFPGGLADLKIPGIRELELGKFDGAILQEGPCLL